MTLLVNVRQSISNAMGMRFTRGMDLVSLALQRRIYARFPTVFDFTNRVMTFFTSVWTEADRMQRREHLAAHTL